MTKRRPYLIRLALSKSWLTRWVDAHTNRWTYAALIWSYLAASYAIRRPYVTEAGFTTLVLYVSVAGLAWMLHGVNQRVRAMRAALMDALGVIASQADLLKLHADLAAITDKGKR